MRGQTKCGGPDAVLRQLQHLLGRPEFDASDRNRNFLQFVVAETLAGRCEYIKAYTIATTVFGRGPDFDPQQDAIVRIEAGRLRRALEHYYLTAGAKDRVRISIPIGSYVPVFELMAPPESVEAFPSAGATPDAPITEFRNPTILVSDFESEGDQSAFPNVTRGFTRQIVVGLTRFSGLTVFGPELAPQAMSLKDALEKARDNGIDFVLSGGTMLSETHFAADVVLLDARSGQCIWAQNFDRTFRAGEMAVARGCVAAFIAGTLAQPYGIIFAYLAAEMDAGTSGHGANTGFMLRFYKYWRTYDASLLGSVVADLERVVRDDPMNAEALAGLSLACSNTVRFGPHSRPAAAAVLLRAQDLARRSIQYRPQSSRGFFALSVTCWFLGDVNGCLEALTTALELNPNDTETMAEMGMRYANLGNWEKAVPLLKEAYSLNPALSGTFRVGLALWHYAHARYAEAYAESLRIDAPQVVYGIIIEAASAARLGLSQQAGSAVGRIMHLHPNYPAQIIEDLSFRNVAPPISRDLIDGLHAAGFPKAALHGNDPKRVASAGRNND